MQRLSDLLTGIDLDRLGSQTDPKLERAAEFGAVRARLPEYLRRPSLEQLRQRVARRELLKACAGWSWGDGALVLLGPTRAGKSSAAAWAWRRLARVALDGDSNAWARALGLQWAHAQELERARREHPMGRGDAPEIRDAAYASLLVIDDVGTDRDPSCVSSVLTERYELGRPTWVTTERTRDQLNAHYGVAIVRRLTEAGGRKPVVVDLREKP